MNQRGDIQDACTRGCDDAIRRTCRASVFGSLRGSVDSATAGALSDVCDATASMFLYGTSDNHMTNWREPLWAIGEDWE